MSAQEKLTQLLQDEDLVPTNELAKLLGVSSAAISNWRRRHSDFPRPVSVWAYKFYNREEVLAWYEKHRNSHGGSRQPELTTVYKMARRLSASDQLRLKEML